MKAQNKESSRAFFERIQRGLWFFVSLFSVYILYETYDLVTNPSAHLNVYGQIPEMVEHLLAALVVVLGFSAVVDCFILKEKQ